jgi:hypothetical protein
MPRGSAARQRGGAGRAAAAQQATAVPAAGTQDDAPGRGKAQERHRLLTESLGELLFEQLPLIAFFVAMHALLYYANHYGGPYGPPPPPVSREEALQQAQAEFGGKLEGMQSGILNRLKV